MLYHSYPKCIFVATVFLLGSGLSCAVPAGYVVVRAHKVQLLGEDDEVCSRPTATER